jgi:hypothetical protein
MIWKTKINSDINLDIISIKINVLKPREITGEVTKCAGVTVFVLLRPYSWYSGQVRASIDRRLGSALCEAHALNDRIVEQSVLNNKCQN